MAFPISFYALHMSSAVTCRSFAHFFIELFLYCWILKVLHIFWIQVLNQMCDLQIFSKLVARNWKKSKAPKWINKLWYNHTTECQIVIKKNKLLTRTTTWLNLSDIMLNKRSHIQKNPWGSSLASWLGFWLSLLDNPWSGNWDPASRKAWPNIIL